MRGARMLARGRALADARMSEAVVVGLYTDGTDEETGDPIRVLVESHYDGPARVKYESLTVSNSNAASQPVAAQKPVLSIPTGSALLPEGDTVRVVESVADALLVDRFYKIDGAPQSGQTTSHRYPLEELS